MALGFPLIWVNANEIIQIGYRSLVDLDESAEPEAVYICAGGLKLSCPSGGGLLAAGVLVLKNSDTFASENRQGVLRNPNRGAEHGDDAKVSTMSTPFPEAIVSWVAVWHQAR
jgi:hypothetical protein